MTSLVYCVETVRSPDVIESVDEISTSSCFNKFLFGSTGCEIIGLTIGAAGVGSGVRTGSASHCTLVDRVMTFGCKGDDGFGVTFLEAGV